VGGGDGDAVRPSCASLASRNDGSSSEGVSVGLAECRLSPSIKTENFARAKIRERKRTEVRTFVSHLKVRPTRRIQVHGAIHRMYSRGRCESRYACRSTGGAAEVF